MKVSELFQRLALGELSNLSMADETTSTLKSEAYPKIILYTNEALLKIYSRFVLLEKDLLIEQVDGITNYELRAKYAEFAGSELGAPFRYIKDLEEEPFEDDVIRILQAFHISGGVYPLNDRDNRNSLFTPSPLVLQVPEPDPGIPLAVTYQARHPKLSTSEDDPTEQVVDIPHYLENALQQLIAAKVFQHMGGQDNLMLSKNFEAAYEADCMVIEDRDLANQTTNTTHTKLVQRGFV